MASVSTITTLVSGAYTIYCIHPFIPYSFVWRYVAVPAFNYLATRNKKDDHTITNPDLEFYEIIKETDDGNGLITKYLVLKKKEDDFTIVDKMS